jgi:hypothetical protein
MKTRWIIAVAAMSIATTVAAGCSGSAVSGANPAQATNVPAAAPAAGNNNNSTQLPSDSAAGTPAGQASGARGPNSGNFAAGQVQKIDGNMIQVSTPNNGALTIQANDQTQVQKLGQGTLADIKQGETLIVQGTKGSDGTFAAQAIRIGGRGGNGPRPGGSGQGRSGGNGQNGGRQFNPDNMAFGQVNQVSGNSVQLSTPDNGTLAVTVSDQTQIQKMVLGSLSDIQTGERVSAQGTRGSDGTFMAQVIQIGGLPGQGRGAPGATASN